MARRVIPNKGELELVMKAMWRAEIRPLDVALYLVLLSYADPSGKSCYPGQRNLAGQLSVSVDTIQRALERLEKAGLIRIKLVWDADQKRTHNEYFLISRAKTCKPKKAE